MSYDNLDFKIPIESEDYTECSNFVTHQIETIVQNAIQEGRNKIVINTNLRLGLPMENINKVAGPFVEAWAFEIFHDALNDGQNNYQLINVEAQERLYMADIILQFQKSRPVGSSVTAEIDVKATAEDIESSGKSPNITSFGRIRSAYVKDPDYIFVILSLKHRVYSKRNEISGMMDGIMEIVNYHAYDLKYLSARDLSYNPALGTGQIQIRDIHYVTIEKRTTWEFCRLLDQKFLGSSRRSFDQWLVLAIRGGWIKTDD
ncbi:MAG: restriction endonuclease [Chloroflexi bacterium]|nr:restriction endonuclease [Chloroflexota bacterium]MBP8055817.1 restriction endonuclease [Chloroflexota bacterium]